MKPGLTSYACAWSIGLPGWPPPPAPLDLPCLLRLAARHRAEVVQLADNLPLLEISAARWQAHLELAQELGITLELGARGLTGPHLDAHLALAAQLGVRLVRFVIDAPRHEPSLAEVEVLLRAAAPRLRDLDVMLALENHDRFAATDLATLIETSANPQVGICLDTANSLGAGEGLATVLARLAPHTVNLHLKDVRVRRLDHQLGFLVEGCPLGTGVVDVGATLAAIAPHRRCAVAHVELWPPPGAHPRESVEREQRWLALSLATLRGHLTPFTS